LQAETCNLNAEQEESGAEAISGPEAMLIRRAFLPSSDSDNLANELNYAYLVSLILELPLPNFRSGMAHHFSSTLPGNKLNRLK